MMQIGSSLVRATIVLSLSLIAAASTLAAEGVILINQAAALTGGITGGDAVGFPVTLSTGGSFRLAGNLRVPDENTTAIIYSG